MLSIGKVWEFQLVELESDRIPDNIGISGISRVCGGPLSHLLSPEV